MITVRKIDPAFEQWPELLMLIREAFSFMEGRIAPASSVHRLTVEKMASHAEEGAVFIAEKDGVLAGCVFCRQREGVLYVGKLAVRPELQREGIGKALIAVVEAEARARKLSALELEVRIELTENHAAFSTLGFRPVAKTSHPGFERPTSITMRREL